MNISYLWLKDFVDIETSPEQLSVDLTNIGLVVETVEQRGSDAVLELDLTTNRPDCLSHFGVAREVSIFSKKALKKIVSRLEESFLPSHSQVAVQIESPELCARYSARVIRGVKVAPSPQWLVQRLETVGIRPVNNVADITNYVLMEMGHPLHAFDLSKIDGRVIYVRKAINQERLVTIDGIERRLSDGMLTIADRARPLALAGIMGGLESEIGFSTQEVLLESAWFDPISIRKTAKLLGVHTEASHRFERGADVNATVDALNRAASLIRELAGGEVLEGVVDCYPRPVKRPIIYLRKARLLQTMGIEIDQLAVEYILNALDFKIVEREQNGWQVSLPTSRLDVEREIDLIEEVARHYGYEKFPSTLPPWKGGSYRPPGYFKERVLKERLIGLGYTETMTYSFIGQLENQKFSNLEPIRLLNPLSSEMEVMRTSLLPGLLRSFLWNYNRGKKNVKLYEMAKIYYWSAEQSEEKVYFGLIMSGSLEERNVHSVNRELNFFDLKGDLEVLLESLSVPLKEICFRLPGQGFIQTNLRYYHPGVLAEMYLGEQRLGVCGQLHPGVCEEYKIRQSVFVAEIPLEAWLNLGTGRKVFREIAKFPSIQRDVSIIVDKDLDYSKIRSAILQANIAEVQTVFPFDLYTGEKLPPDKKGVSISIIYQAVDRTLTEEEVNRFQEAVLALLREKLGAQLRN
jgi:phenylalanyl-tRNA synthetase beta chain